MTDEEMVRVSAGKGLDFIFGADDETGPQPWGLIEGHAHDAACGPGCSGDGE